MQTHITCAKTRPFAIYGPRKHWLIGRTGAARRLYRARVQHDGQRRTTMGGRETRHDVEPVSREERRRRRNGVYAPARSVQKSN